MTNPGITDLVAYWRMDEQSGMRYDSHGSYDLIAVFSPLYDVGKRGKALDLVAASTQTLYHVDDPGLSMGGVSFEIGLWIKPHNIGATARLVNKWDAGGNYEYLVQCSGSRISIWVRNAANTTSYNVTANNFGDLSNGIWYYVNAYYDEGSDVIGIGVNTVFDTDSGPSAAGGGVRDSTNRVYFGRDSSSAFFFDGLIDEVSIYKDRLLSSPERSWMYNSGYGRTYSELASLAPPPIDIVTIPTIGTLLIHVLDSSLNVIGIIEDYYSLIWSERYAEVGDFELELPIEHAENSIVDFGNFLYIKSSDALMIIEDIKPSIGKEKSSLVVKGQSAESLLKRRVLLDPINLSGPAEIAIYSFINNHITDPADSDRRITLLATEFPEMLTTVLYEEQVEMQTVYDAIKTICMNTDLGFKVVLYNDELVFYVHEGADRSYDQSTNPYIIFAETFDNVIASSFYESIKDKKNTTLVATDDSVESLQRVFVWEASEPTNLNRYESVLETTITRDIDGDPLDDAEVLAIITTRGLQEIEENKIVGLFEGDFDIQGNFEYGVDFFMGDILQCNLEGRNVKARIIELVRSYSTEGEKAYIAMDFII